MKTKNLTQLLLWVLFLINHTIITGCSVSNRDIQQKKCIPFDEYLQSGHQKDIVAFVSTRDSEYYADFEIYLMYLDGSEEWNITNHSNTDNQPSWSPDGKQIAFISYRNNNEPDLFIMDSDGTNQRSLTNSSTSADLSPSWSPDGQYIAFVSERGGQSDPFIIKPDGTGLIDIWVTRFQVSSIAWAPDNKKVAMSAFPPDSLGNYHYSEIFSMNIDGTELTNLTNSPYNDLYPSWSPDGRFLSFASHRDGQSEIYVLDLNTKNTVRITNNTSVDSLPSWSPDSCYVIYASNRNGSMDLFVAEKDGGQEYQLTNHPDSEDHPMWFPYENHE